jgi:cellulose synthase/poly-beta-1,6-N-acetylglucosamine synthase-like glycosyltransferase
MVSLTVIVPATDAPATLPRCLAAIDAAEEGPEEVVVADRPASLSAAAARNAGAARATGDVLVFVDADVVVHPNAFRRIRAAFRDDVQLDAVYGSYDDSPSAPSVVSTFRNLLHHHVHHAAAGPAETFWAGIGAVRRTVFFDVGGFDAARYPHPSVEDIDLGRRLHAAGARIVLDPTIQGTHLKSWTLRSMVWTDFARRAIPWVALEWRTRRLSSALNLGWRHRLSALACVVGVVALVLGWWLIALGALGALLLLNRAFYALLLRRLGLAGAAAGVALHALHHLVAAAALPMGVALGVVLGGMSSSTTSRRRTLPPPIVAEEHFVE